MKKYTPPNVLLTVILCAGLLNCGSNKEVEEVIPPAPTSINQTIGFLKGKELKVIKSGQYGMAILDDKPEIEWIDTTVQKNSLTVRLMNEIGNWSMKFVNDTACSITSGGKNYTGTWSVDEKADEDETPGIRLRVKYMDPEFNSGLFEGSPVTYSYVVKGISDKRVLLDLPRELNRRKLVSLMEIR